MTIELVSFTHLKDLLGLSESSIDHYPALSLLRDSVTASIESFLGRELECMERTTTIQAGSSSRMISLPAIPVESVSSVSVNGQNLDQAFFTKMEYGILLSFFPLPGDGISITYTGGLSSVPGDIARAALLQTAFEFQNKEHLGAKSVSTEGGSVSVPGFGLLNAVKSLLIPHIHPLKTGKAS